LSNNNKGRWLGVDGSSLQADSQPESEGWQTLGTQSAFIE